MARSTLTLFALVLAAGLSAPAFAQEAAPYQVKDCGIMCKLWRNVSGKAQVSYSGQIPNDVTHDPRPLRADEGTEMPDPAKIMAVRGTVVAETPAERRRREKDYADLLKKTERPAGGEMNAVK